MPRSLLAIVLFTLQLSGLTSAESLTNEYCPVIPEEYAHEEFFLNYRGVEVHFCCDRCIAKFRKNPEAYLDLLPQFANRSAPGWWESIEVPASVRFPLLVGALLAFGLLLVRVRSARRRRAQSAPAPRPRGAGKRTITVGLNLLAVVAALGLFYVLAWRPLAEMYFTREEGLLELVAQFGRPPMPPKLESGSALGGVYYRGNDERSSNLFNGGNYRTATFELFLEDAKGAAVSVDQPAGDRSLHLRLEIDRPPHTAAHYYSAEMMSRCHLTSSFETLLRCRDPSPDCIALEPTVENQHWQARYTLGELPSQGQGELAGCVYFFRGLEIEGLYRSTIYYGIRYALHSQDGVLLPGSELWMGNLYYSPAVSAGAIPLSEWYTLKIIPVISEEWHAAQLKPDTPR